ncbi:MAG: HRDC domain-containing protein, partial [Acidobacteria bacterium]|nr:HRDC domain-containing protein [Acidobacteriota bacterium]
GGLPFDSEVAQSALEKLWIHGGARVTPEGDASRGSNTWKKPYLAMREERLWQIQQMTRFAEGHACRMAALVRHFGDTDDRKPCGLCDVCSPGSVLVQRSVGASGPELEIGKLVLASLRARDRQGSSQLHKSVAEIAPSVDRQLFDRVLGGLARTAYVRVEMDSFEKDGQTIRFQRVSLLPKGMENARPEFEVVPEPKRRKRREREKKGAKAIGRPRPAAVATTLGPKAARPAASAEGEALAERLRSWRLAAARKAKVPAFTIFPDRTLQAIAEAAPRDTDELLDVPGMGPTLVKKYGAAILSLVKGAG